MRYSPFAMIGKLFNLHVTYITYGVFESTSCMPHMRHRAADSGQHVSTVEWQYLMKISPKLKLGTGLGPQNIVSSKLQATSCDSSLCNIVNTYLGGKASLSQLLIIARIAADVLGSGIAIALSVRTSLILAIDFLTCVADSNELHCANQVYYKPQKMGT